MEIMTVYHAKKKKILLPFKFNYYKRGKTLYIKIICYFIFRYQILFLNATKRDLEMRISNDNK